MGAIEGSQTLDGFHEPIETLPTVHVVLEALLAPSPLSLADAETFVHMQVRDSHI